MCGIVGVAAFGAQQYPTVEQLKRMCDSLIHRGPDEEGLEVKDGVGIGIRRLSIIDLVRGSQPICNEDRSVRTVFNGEIYNFRELRRDLEGRGHQFRTQTDTEVIVHGYEEYGNRLPLYLNGMFAFAVHDSRRRKLLLVRDHVGIKPLFYAFTPRYLVWGSEIKALLASGLLDRELNMNGLAQFLAWEYVPGRETLFSSIHKLEAGHLLEVDLDHPRCEPTQYWDLPPSDESSSLKAEDWEEAIDAKLRECVTRQLVSDVPLGAFLSGGVDSSLVVSAMGPARTFSIGFDERSYNELRWARKVADHLRTDHKDEIVKPDVVDLFQRLMKFLDDPIGDFSIFPTYLVSRLARRDVTVVLSGDGGDELFGGYETYVAQQRAGQYEKIPRWCRRVILEPAIRAMRPRDLKKGIVNKAKRFVDGISHPQPLSHARWRLFLSRALQDTLFTPEARTRISSDPRSHVVEMFERAREREPLNASLYVDFKTYLCDNILVKVDRMSMATSLEARVPYLDRELVELAFRVPDVLKAAHGETKVLLKRVAARHVPRECVYRPKEGFSIPMKSWLGYQFRPLMEELLDEEKLRKQGVLDAAVVERLKREHLAGVANHSHLLWSTMVFEAWHDMWLSA